MSSNIIKKKYLKLIKEINKHNKLYYDKSLPIISDQKYDSLKKDILEIEKNNKNLIDKNSPSKIIGYKPSKNFQKYRHRVKMLSLSNAFNKDDLINFEKKIFNYLNRGIKLNYSVEFFCLHSALRVVLVRPPILEKNL